MKISTTASFSFSLHCFLIVKIGNSPCLSLAKICCYQVSYHPEWVKKSLELKEPEGGGTNVMLSFAWIAADYLARVKIRAREIQDLDLDKPVNSLMGYLAERI